MADTKIIALVMVAGVAALMTVVFTVVMATYGASVSSELRHVVSVLNSTERRLTLMEGSLAQLQALVQSRQEALADPKAGDDVSLEGSRRILERLDVAENKMQVTLDIVKEMRGDMAPWKEETRITTSLLYLLNESLAELNNASEHRLQGLEETFSEHGEDVAETFVDSSHLLQSMTSAMQSAQSALTTGLEELGKGYNVTQGRLDAVERAVTRQEDILLTLAQNATASQEKTQTRVLAEMDKLLAKSSEWQSRLSSQSNASLEQLQRLQAAVGNGSTALERHLELRQKRDEVNDQHQRRTAELLDNATSSLAELRNLLKIPENSSDSRLLHVEELLVRLTSSSENHSEAIEDDLQTLNAGLVDFKLASEMHHNSTLQQLDKTSQALLLAVKEGVNRTLDAVLGSPQEEASVEGNQSRRSCEEYRLQGFTRSGLYNLSLQDGLPDFQVFCDMETDSKAWVVIQRRKDGSIDFYRDWNAYKEGFGNLSGEFWLGNDKIHRLTASGQTRARFELADWEGLTRHAQYSSFQVADAGNEFRLKISGYSGDAGDGMAYHDGYAFATKDQGNESHCARSYTGAWWYRNCHHVNLNGHYYRTNPCPGSKGVNWLQWRGYTYSLKGTEIKLR